MSTQTVSVRFSVDNVDTIKAAMLDLGASGQAVLDKLEAATAGPSAGLQALNAVSEDVQSTFEEMTASLGPLGSALQALGAGGIAAGAALGAAVEGVKALIENSSESELALTKVSAMIAATGDASGKTVDQINAFADALSTSTLATKQDVLQAATQLMAFPSIAGDAFNQVLTLSEDLATAGFGDLASNATRLGRALEDPTKGMTQLRREGILLTQTQQDQIKALQASGDLMGAQALLIADITAKVGGVGAAGGNTLTGAWHAFGQEFGIAMEAINDKAGNWSTLTGLIQGATNALKGWVAAQNPITSEQTQATVLSGQYFDQLINGTNGSMSTLAQGVTGVTPVSTDQLKAQVEALQEDIQAQSQDKAMTEQLAQMKSVGAQAENNLTQAVSAHSKEVQAALVFGDNVLAQLDAEEQKRETLITSLMTQSDSEARMFVAVGEGTDAVNALNIQLAQETNLRKLGTDATSLEIAQSNAETAAIIGSTEALKTYNKTKALQTQVFNQAAKAEQTEADQQARALAQEQRAIQQFADQAGTQVLQSFTNMLNGTKAPFDNLLKYAETTFEKIAAAAILNPVLVPIITDFVGGISSAVGSNGSLTSPSTLGGSTAQFGLAGYGLFGGGLGGSNALFGTLGNTVSDYINTFGANTLGLSMPGYTVASEGDAVAGELPTISSNLTLSSLLGVAALGGLGGSIFSSLIGGNSTYGGLGGATGATIGMLAGGPLGAVAGGLIGSLASLFGPGPSNETEGYQFDPGTGSSTQVGNAPGSAKFSQTNLTNAQNFQTAVGQFVQGILGSVQGSSYIGGTVGFDTGNTQGSNVYLYNPQGPGGSSLGALSNGSANFSDPATALAATMQALTSQFAGIPADVATAFQHIDWTGDLTTNLGLVQFAADFQSNIKAMEQGTLSIQQDAYDEASATVQSYITQIEQFKTTTAQLGLSTDDADTATKAFVDTLLNGTPTLDAVQTAIQTVLGTAQALPPLLEEVGESADAASTYLQNALNNIGDSLQNTLQTEDYSALGETFMTSLATAISDEATNMSDAQALLGAGGQDLTGLVTQTFNDTVASIINSGSLTAANLQLIASTFTDFPVIVADANTALANLNSTLVDTSTTAAAAVPTLLKSLTSSMTDALNTDISDLNTSVSFWSKTQTDFSTAANNLELDSSTTALSPSDQLALAQQIFNQDSAGALSGNQTDVGNLQNDGQTLVTLAKQMYGSTDQFVDIQEQVESVFEQVSQYAGAQTNIANQQLTVAEEQLAELTKIANSTIVGGTGTLYGGAGSATPTTGADLAALTSSYGSTYDAALASGMTPSQFASSQTYALYENAVVSDIGNLSDVGTLENQLSTQAGQLTSTDPTAQSAPVIANAVVQQLASLGVVDASTATAINTEATAGAISDLTTSINNLLARLPRAA